MSEWIDFAICAAFLAVFWFVAPAAGPRWTVAFLKDRNAAWVAAHPETVRRLADSRWFARSCYVLGVLSFAVLLALQLGLWSDPPSSEHWQGLWGVTMASLVIGGVYNVACAWLFGRWLNRVPLAERRHATLEPRVLADYLSHRQRHATYAFVAAVPATWLLVGALGMNTSADFWKQLTTLAILSATFSALFSQMPHLTVKRPPNMMDRVLGPANRPTEVRSTFAIQLIPPIVGTIHLFQEVTGLTPLDVQRGCQLGMVILLTLAFVQYARLPRGSGDGDTAKQPAISS